MSHKGENNPFFGKKHSKETKEKISKNHKNSLKIKKHIEHLAVLNHQSPPNEKHYCWKGNKVGYRALHDWVNRRLGKATFCVKCKLDKIPEGKKRFFQWANISHNYKRELTDWFQLCIPCHITYDKK